MVVTETQSEFLVEFDYNPRLVREVKRIGGGVWNPVLNKWRFPLNKRAEIEAFKLKHGFRESGPKYDFSNIPELPELTIDIPLKRPMFPFQKNGVAYTLEKDRVIIGDDPGLGKTTQAIAAAIAKNQFPVLVACPASLKLNWQQEWLTVAGINSMILQDSVKNTWPIYYKTGLCKVFIVNFESVRKYFVDRIDKPDDGIDVGKAGFRLKHIQFRESISLFKTIIIDELHRLKDPGTQTAKFVKGVCKGKENIYGLTGTPVVNKPRDLISQLGIIGRLGDFGGEKYFINRYCGGGSGNGATNLEELNYKLKSICFYRRLKKDVLKDLPDKIRQKVICEITTRKEYLAAINDLGNYLKQWRDRTDAEIRKSLRGEIMVKIGLCKNISARGKMNEVIEHIDDVIDSGEKIVVFIHQKDIAERLLKHYPTAVSIRGTDTTEQRNANVKAFQTNPNIRVIVCNIKAGGVGITLTASSRVAFVELPWHPADCTQCEDRCHRIGQKDSVQATYFLGKNTIDEDIYQIIESKREVANTITGSEENIQTEIIEKLTKALI
jgi:SWI/SNF-related matrix-associated actin-dependent regulator of chromatin subfamily A-like protein 1